MLYIFYGIEEFIIKKKIEALWKAKGFNKNEVIRLNLNNQSLSEVVNQVEQSNLFSSNTFVIADDFDLFISKKQPYKTGQISKLINFSNQKNDSILVLVCNKDKIPKNDFQKKLGEFSEIIECAKLGIGNKRQMISKAFENRGVEITPQLIDYFIKRSGMSIRGLILEVDKIALTYKRISESNIDELIYPCIENNVFSLVDTILNKNYEESIKKYEDLVNSGTSPLAILTLVGNEIAIMSAIIESDFWNTSSQEIAELFKKPAFVISKAKKKMIKYNRCEIININKKISKLEFEFKTGKISQDIFIQFLILELIKGEND